MGKFPTFEDYQKTGKYRDGLKRADDLLKKNPNDPELLILKYQLLCADKQDGKPILDQLLAIKPPVQQIADLFTINAAVVQSQRNVWPRPQTVGTEVAKLWENAVKATTTTNYKLEMLIQRFESSVEANYMVDAQQALIQLKAIQPKNRVIYMAHAAVTQLISTSKEDMQSRLALMLAKKAVNEKFDEEKDLDCRVPGQIFAMQGAIKDLEGIQGRRFDQSKQVFEALREMKKSEANGAASTAESEDASKQTPNEKLIEETASLKACFAKTVETSAGLEPTLSLAVSAMKLFQTSIKGNPDARSRTKGEACFVAISALVKAYELSGKLTYLLISAHLAGSLLIIDWHIHEAKMILVYLYMRLGFGVQALKYFDSLSIKEVQFDTVGHALFTDLSYTHPHQLPTGSKEERNPLSRAKNAVQVYRRCEDKLSETEASVLSNGQTGMIFDLHELRDKLRSSITKRIIFLEIRRQARLLLCDSNWHTQDLGPTCVANWIETTDNRDFAATFNHGLNVEKALHGYGESLLGREWLLHGLALDVSWCLAIGKGADSPIEDPETLVKELEDTLTDVSRLHIDDSSASPSSFGKSYHLAADLACQVLKLVVLVRAKPTANDLKSIIADVERGIDKLHVRGLCGRDDVFAESLREHYMFFDVLKVAERACEFAAKQSQGGAEDLSKLQQRCADDVTALREHAEQQRNEISAANMKAEMAKEGEVSVALKAFGEEGLNDFCESVASGAREGWEGLGKLKM